MSRGDRIKYSVLLFVAFACAYLNGYNHGKKVILDRWEQSLITGINKHLKEINK